MSSVLIDEARRYVADSIGAFRQKRLDNLERLKLSNRLKRRNYHLLCTNNIYNVQDFIKITLDAHLSPREQTLFGDFLEGSAIYIKKVYKGCESTAEGINLEFGKAGVRFIGAIKSGLNWDNSGPIMRMRNNFRKAARILRTSPLSLQVI